MSWLKKLFYPTGCLVCGGTLSGDERCICRHCLPKLPRTEFHLNPGNPAEQLFYGRCEVERCACFCYYERGGDLRHIIHQFKYHDSPRSAWQLGDLYARELLLTGWQKPIDILIPVPLHFLKKNSRGYNQSEWIARGLSNVWQKPIRTDVLRKKRHNTSQTHKSLYERYLNATDSYLLKNEKQLAGKHLLLIDDVLTSGSTLEACVHALKSLPNVKISILTLGFAE